MNWKYNYIIAGSGGFYEVAYYDLMQMPNVKYYKGYTDGIEGRIKRLLCRLCFNLTVNKYISTPFKRIVFPWLFQSTFETQKPLCYLFFGNQFAVVNTRYIEYLKRIHPDAKIVLYMQDIVSSLPYYDIKSYKQRFDLILSYDRGDCERYNLTYHPTPYSYYPILNHKKEDIDVFFCGAAKTRYKTILTVYQKLIAQGLKCKFYIIGVPKDEQVQGEGLIYNQRISYIENLEYVAASKCILEIMQENADGFTPRLWEAIMYDKHLLTNNKSIVNSMFWDEKGIHLVDFGSDFSFIKSQPIAYSRMLKENKSPYQILVLIESIL